MRSNLVFLAALVVSFRAFAQAPADAPQASPETAVHTPVQAVAHDEWPRLRLGASALGGGGNYGFGVLGGDLRLGAQLSTHWSVDAELGATSIGLADLWRAGALVNFTPVDAFSLSAGIIGGRSSFRPINSTEKTFSSVGGTVRADVNFVVARSPAGRRHAITLGLAADVVALWAPSTAPGYTAPFALFANVGYLTF